MQEKEEGKNAFFLFYLDQQAYALPLRQVECVVRAVEIYPLPLAAAELLGVINFQGSPVPVWNMRKLLALPEREARLDDALVIVKEQALTAFLADRVSGIFSCTQADVAYEESCAMRGISGIAKRAGEIVYLCDLKQMLPKCGTV
ncbi:chemotaxis protein CheW [Azotosporobacter soli]|uniref:chemotaxis protein CheW n=1 Tax=Azotosporobacter soli TaxID=3055040 RepID=UPI0031FE78AA